MPCHFSGTTTSNDDCTFWANAPAEPFPAFSLVIGVNIPQSLNYWPAMSEPPSMGIRLVPASVVRLPETCIQRDWVCLRSSNS
jgi:hypothetical protein